MIRTTSNTCIGSRAQRLFLTANPKIRPVGKKNALAVPSFRLHSSTSINSTETGATTNPSRGCPHHEKRTGSNGMATSTTQKVEFVKVPQLPLVGSMIPLYSNMEAYDLSNVYNIWCNNRKKFGDFYSAGLPSSINRNNITGETFVMTDPKEFMKVLRTEGNYPYGAVTVEWPVVRYYQEAEESSPGAAAGSALFGHGPEWQRIRRFMQTDLLHPSAAKGYVGGMIRACQIASEGAPLHSKNIEEYTAFCSFDMFSSVAFGEFPGLASGKSEQEENRKFCERSLSATGLILPMMTSLTELAKNGLGMKSELYSTFEKNFSVSRDIASLKLKNFQKRKENNELLNEFEKNSYSSLALDRFQASKGEEGAINEDDVAEIIVVGLVAALDTTSSLLNWCLFHLATNPEVQAELYREVSRNVAESGTDGLTESCFTKSNSVYLDALLRENHRITPPVAFNLTKQNRTSDVEIHGKTIPKDNTFFLDSRSAGMDPNFVKDPDTFDPSRWFESETKKRKGTPAEFLDHPLYREPFSAGARKCPGSRVANYEAKILLSQLVLDWKISLEDTGETAPKSWRDVSYFAGLTVQPEVPPLSFERRQ